MKHKKSLLLPASPFSSSSFSRSSISSSSSESLGSKGKNGAPLAKTRVSAPIVDCSHSAKQLDLYAPIVPYVELLGRSHFSFLQGASSPEEMVLQAKNLFYSGLAIVDVNGFYGSVRGYQAAEKPSAFDTEQLATPQHPFRYIVGAELTPYDASALVLLPMNKTGYSRLSRLLTQAKRSTLKGHSWLRLQEILDDCEDLLAFALPPWSETTLKLLQEAFQDRLYLPVYKDYTWESVVLYQQALEIEANLQIQLFATGRPLYHRPERKLLHDVLTCILHKTTLQEAATQLTLNRERYLRSLPQLAFLWRERPDLLARTLEIASRLHFSLSELRYRYPHEVLPPGQTTSEFLRFLVEKGLHWRFPDGISEGCRKQVAHELSLIEKLEYEDYFLTLRDICQFATSKGIIHQGRGSAANSVVCYVLGLTNIDPIRMGLLFERFISAERGEPPDIDIDFEHERREEVIQYIYQKYGEAHAAMVCTTICFRSRMAVREVAKVLGVPLEQINRLIKYMGREGLSNLLQHPVEIQKFGLTPERFQLLLSLALEIQGFPRHLGIHTGGFVIAHDPVIDIVPVEKATMEGRFVVQWNKDDINLLGLMKVDVLSLGMLTALRKSLDMLKQHKNIDWNLAQIPAEDVVTYKMIQKADTIGVFQIESRAQMSLLPRLKPTCFYDLVIEVAIVRPGPIQGGMVHPFLRRRDGIEKITYAHPRLEPILKKTLGVPIFQEQIMQVAVAVAGFTPGEADELRRIMSSAWTKGSIMHTLRQRLLSGMISNGITLQYAEQVYKVIEGFSSYGFPESHAASFALLTYASCYLKCHHPEVFTCAVLNSQPMGFYSPRQLIADAQRHGVECLPLDIQSSTYDYHLEKSSEPSRHNPLPCEHMIKICSETDQIDLEKLNVRVGFRSIYGLPKLAVEKLVETRNLEGPFLSLHDFARRTRLNRSLLLRLAAAGAFDSFGHSPRQALWAIQSLILDSASLLFGHATSGPTDAPVSENSSLIPTENAWQKIQREYQTKGFSVDSHPLAILRPYLQDRHPRYVTAQETEKLRHQTRLRMAGLLSLLQKPPTAKGMCFLSLEDETGIFNVVVVPQLYPKIRLLLQSASLLEIDGWLESRHGVRNLRAEAIRPLKNETFLKEIAPKNVTNSPPSHE